MTTDRGAAVASALGELTEEARRLARCLAAAAFVEPALLRRLRLEVANTRVSTELEIADWSGVETRAPDGLTLERALLVRLRQQLAQDASLLERALAVVDDAHAHAPPLLRLEERIVAVVLRANGADVTARIEDELSSVLAAMEERGDRRADIAAWAARTLPRFPPEALDVAAARILSYVASAHVPTARFRADTLSTDEAARARALLPGKRTKLYVRAVTRAADNIIIEQDVAVVRLSAELAAREKPKEGSWHELEAPDSEPIVVNIDGTSALVTHGETLTVPAASALPVRIHLADGCVYELRDGAPSGAVATIRNLSGPSRFAYVVDRDLAVTASLAQEPSVPPLVLEFPWGTATGSVVATSDRVTQASVIRLTQPIDVVPLALRDGLNDGDGVQMLTSGAHGEQWLSARVGPYFSGDGLNHVFPDAEPDAIERKSVPGAPLTSGGVVVGHVRNVVKQDGPPQKLFACPARFSARALCRALPVPPDIEKNVANALRHGTFTGAVRVHRELVVCGPDVNARPGMRQAALDLEHATLLWDDAREGELPLPLSLRLRAGALGVAWLGTGGEAHLARVTRNDDDDVRVYVLPFGDPPQRGAPVIVDGGFAGFLLDARAGNEWSVLTLRQVLADAVTVTSGTGATANDRHSAGRALSWSAEGVGDFHLSSGGHDDALGPTWDRVVRGLPYRRLAQLAIDKLTMSRVAQLARDEASLFGAIQRERKVVDELDSIFKTPDNDAQREWEFLVRWIREHHPGGRRE